MTKLKGNLAKLAAILFAATAPALLSPVAAAESGLARIERQNWTFGGLIGYYDRAQLQRGYKVYHEVCANCHSLKLLSYRNLGQPGGPEFSQTQVAAIAATAQVEDGPNDEGAMFMRPAKPVDRFASRYKNDKEAAAANNGAVPPDLSVIAKARGIARDAPWYIVPFNMLHDLLTQYQEQGADYIYALLTGYADPPAGMEIAPGMNYNKAFPGHQTAMPPPLSSDGLVEYDDGTPATIDNYARDVTAFLMWAAEPHLEERKKLGLQVILYLIILSILLYLSKRALWRDVDH